MKARLALSAALLSILASGPVLANVPAQVRVDVPFDFHAGDTALPAGSYTIERASDATVVVRDAERHVRATLHTLPAAVKVSTDASAVVLFHRYGDQSFLREVQSSSGFDRSLQRTEQERVAAATWAEQARYKVLVGAKLNP